MLNEKNSPFKIAPALLALGAIGSVGASYFGYKQSQKAEQEAADKERIARAEMNRWKDVYSDLDTSNPFANLQNRFTGMENTMEDLTINQKQAEFESQQFQQSQANILGNLRGAAGGSGIASLAQSLSQQGQIAAQRASASIGQQEAANQMAERREAARLDTLERQQASSLDIRKAQQDRITQQMEMGKTATQLNMAQQQVAAYMEQGSAATQSKWDAFGTGISSIASIFGGAG